MKAGTGEAALGRIKDVLAPGALDVGLQLGHWNNPLRRHCGAAKKNE